jgi:threonylcarbamoyladenosine tRNA methylthiotransferase CDKAL1
MDTCSLADLEDLASTGELTISNDRVYRDQVMPRVKVGRAAQRRKERKMAKNGYTTDSKDSKESDLSHTTHDYSQVNLDVPNVESNGAGPSIVPGTQKIWMKTFGCAHNVSDGEYMQGMLGSYGYKFVDTKEEADLIFLNSCTVKNPSEMAVVNIVNSSEKRQIPVVMAGCVPQGDRKMEALSNISIVGISQIDRVVEVVEETLKGNTVRLLSRRTKDKEGKSSILPRLDLPKVRRNPLVEIVPLSTGCLGACTYCKTRHARGKLGSYKKQELLDRIRTVVAEREVTEIWLSSEDTGAYGIDLGITIADLLVDVVKVLPDDQSVMLRIGMTNPPYMLEHLDAIADALNHPSVFSFLHVPVQSGSDHVLSDALMNREYTREDFETVARHLLHKVPGLLLATDVICGFPGETTEDHEATLSLVQEFQFPVLNISQFYPRPGTPAAKMKPLPSKLKKERSREMTHLFHSYRHLDTMFPVGTLCKVWVANEINPAKATRRAQTICHTKNYTKVVVPLMTDEHKGARLMVRVLETHKFHVVAEVVEVLGMKRSKFDDTVKIHRQQGARATSSTGSKISFTKAEVASSSSASSSTSSTSSASSTSSTSSASSASAASSASSASSNIEKSDHPDVALYTDGPMVDLGQKTPTSESGCCGGEDKDSGCCGGGGGGDACCGGGDEKTDSECCGGGGTATEESSGACGCAQPTFDELLAQEEKYKQEQVQRQTSTKTVKAAAKTVAAVAARQPLEQAKHHAVSMMLLTHVFLPTVVALLLMKLGMVMR